MEKFISKNEEDIKTTINNNVNTTIEHQQNTRLSNKSYTNQNVTSTIPTAALSRRIKSIDKNESSNDKDTNIVDNSNPKTSLIHHTPYRSAGGKGTKSFSVQIPNVQHFLPVPAPTRKTSPKPKESSDCNFIKHQHQQQNPIKVDSSSSSSNYKNIDYQALSLQSLVTKERRKIEDILFLPTPSQEASSSQPYQQSETEGGGCHPQILKEQAYVKGNNMNNHNDEDIETDIMEHDVTVNCNDDTINHDEQDEIFHHHDDETENHVDQAKEEDEENGNENINGNKNINGNENEHDSDDEKNNRSKSHDKKSSVDDDENEGDDDDDYTNVNDNIQLDFKSYESLGNSLLGDFDSHIESNEKSKNRNDESVTNQIDEESTLVVDDEQIEPGRGEENCRSSLDTDEMKNGIGGEHLNAEKETYVLDFNEESKTQPSTSCNHLSLNQQKDHIISRHDDDENDVGDGDGEPKEIKHDQTASWGFVQNCDNLHLDQNIDEESKDVSIENEISIGSAQSSGVFSSITNFSTAASISTFESSRSPGLSSRIKHLDRLTSNTPLHITPFAKPHSKRESDKIDQSLLKVWKEVFNCESKEEAVSLAVQQSKLLNDTSFELVDALMKYVERFCYLPSDIFHTDGIDFESPVTNEVQRTYVESFLDMHVNNQEQKGLVLPASAIGWLASHLFSTEEDNYYFDQFQQRQRGDSFAINPRSSRALFIKLERVLGIIAEHVTHLKIIGTTWPSSAKDETRKPKSKGKHNKKKQHIDSNIDAQATTSFLAYFRYIQNRPHVDMRLFPNVTYLELEAVPPEYITNLEVVSNSLKTITVHKGCIVNTPKFLSCGNFVSLNHLSLSECAINEFAAFDGTKSTRGPSGKRLTRKNPPLAEMKALVSLNLSHNQFQQQETALAGLSELSELMRVDLSNNKIACMNRAHLLIGNIQSLDLSQNRLRNVDGIDCLYSLEVLLLGNNLISNFEDVVGLAKLPELIKLQLKGNPLEKNGAKNLYRLKLLNMFKVMRLDKNDKGLTYRDMLCLLPNIDDHEVTKKELIYLRNMTFSQSVVSTQEDISQKDPPKTTGTLSILEPFRDEYVGPDGCTLAVSMNTHQGQKRTTLKSRKRRIEIYDASASVDKASNIGKLIDLTSKTEGTKYKSQYPSFEIILDVIFPLNNTSPVKMLNNDDEVIEHLAASNKSDVEAVEEKMILNRVANDDDSMDEVNVNDFILDQIDAALKHPIILYEKIGRCRDPPKFDPSIKKDCEGDIDENNNASSISISSHRMLQMLQLDNDNSTFSTNHYGFKTPAKTAQEKLVETFDFAVAERTATYDGPEEYTNLLVSSYLELYFKSFIFPSSKYTTNMDNSSKIQEKQLPRIQLYQTDRDLMVWTLAQNSAENLSSQLEDNLEQFIHLSNERVIPCGIAATGRVAPVKSDAKGARGGTLFHEGKPLNISEDQDLLLCVSNKAIYFIPNTDDGLKHKKRRFPASIPLQVKFEDAVWPHAYCRHPLKYLRKISFDGYGFQRLTLHFKLPSLRGEIFMQPENGDIISSSDYTYVVFTCDQRYTIQLMQILQRGAREASPNNENMSNDVHIENDDNSVISAIASAIAPKAFTDDILGYHILTQIWQSNDTEGSRRAFLLTNESIFLLHETYSGDGSGNGSILNEDSGNVQNGEVAMRIVASSTLDNIADVCILDVDSRKIVVTTKSNIGLRRTSRWLLLCKDSENAERLVQDVRKAMKV